MAGGELAVKIKSASCFGDDFVRPTFLNTAMDGTVATDLNLAMDEGCFHIVGDNDWAFLALDIIEPIKREAKKILFEQIKPAINRIENNYERVAYIKLGVNDKRILDVFCGGRGKCDKIFGYPIWVDETEENLVMVVTHSDVNDEIDTLFKEYGKRK